MVESSKKASRLGVGASTARSQAEKHPSEATDWTKSGKKQILSIGKKRRRGNDVHDDEDDHDDVAGGSGRDGDDSSSDEEEGRTSAVVERKRKIIRHSLATTDVEVKANAVEEIEQAPAAVNSTSKKKKKRGKRERLMEIVETNQTPNDALKDSPSKTVKVTKSNDSNDQTHSDCGGGDIENKNGNDNDTKRKRKKVRSRQKNIRKDTRAANDKPSYLILGRSDYAGRPLTKETRQKLGIKSSTPTLESGEWVGGWTSRDVSGVVKDGGTSVSKPTSDGGEVSFSKIGDCIVSDTIMKDDHSKGSNAMEHSAKIDRETLNTFDESAENNITDGMKKKKKKQKKYKNLIV